jgi:hypothetical protein
MRLAVSSKFVDLDENRGVYTVMSRDMEDFDYRENHISCVMIFGCIEILIESIGV